MPSILVKWTVETLNATVDRDLTALPADMRARFVANRGRLSLFVLAYKPWGLPAQVMSA